MEEQNKEKKVIRYRLEKHKWPDEIQAEKDHRLKIAIVICICIACFLSGFMMNGVMNQSGVASSDEYDKWQTIGILAKMWKI